MVEFYYPEEIAAFEPRIHRGAARRPTWKPAIEDDEIGERMDAGRRPCWNAATTKSAPTQSPMEDGMQHFHEWYRQNHGQRGASALRPPGASPICGQKPIVRIRR